MIKPKRLGAEDWFQTSGRTTCQNITVTIEKKKK
jgi:hypothetical protein